MISDQNRSAAVTQALVAAITAGGRGMGTTIARKLGTRCSWPPTHTDVAGTIPMRRIGTIVEIAKTAAFLPSDDADYITGQNVRVDGGITHHV
jgi:enoyl-[acyl-carrier-protein] reductase (NADH)